jgi:hypothetical protein
MNMAQEAGLGRRFGEFIMNVARGEFDGKIGRSRLIGETGICVDGGDMTREEQALVLREWEHPRRRPQPAGNGEDGAATWEPPEMDELEDAEEGC